jgi:Mor family transcriptional regulator
MKTIRLATYASAVIAAIGLSLSVHAEDTDSGGGKFYFPVGIAYGSGIHKATEKLFDFYKADGFHGKFS